LLGTTRSTLPRVLETRDSAFGSNCYRVL
jgi:hypothetical protein